MDDAPRPSAPRRRLYPWPLSLIALLIAGAATYAVYYPSTYQLSVAACRALFAWFVWYEAYWHFAADLQRWATLAPLPFAFVATFWAVRRLATCGVRAWRPGGARGPLRAGIWSARVLLGAVALPSGLALAAAILLPAMAFGPGYYTTGGKRLQRASCSHCHSPYRPFHFFRPPEQWDRTVHRMRTLEGAPIDEEEQARIVRYLSSRCSYTDAWMFRAKCLRCHDRDQLEATPRSAEEWEAIADRAARLSPYAYRQDWLDQVKRHAAAELAVSMDQTPLGAETEGKLTFERHCGACHYLDGAAAPPTGEVEGVVRTMAAKVPDRMSSQEVDAVVRYLREHRPEPADLNSAFPHDHLVEVDW